MLHVHVRVQELIGEGISWSDGLILAEHAPDRFRCKSCEALIKFLGARLYHAEVVRNLCQEEAIHGLDCRREGFVGKILFQQSQVRSLSETAESLQQVGSLAILATGFLQHVKQVSELTQETLLKYAGACCMVQGKVSEKWNKLEELEKGICKGVGNVGFETRESGLIVESVTL